MKLYYTSRAKFDLESAFFWYENQQRGLGMKFLDSIEKSTKLILDFPEMFRIIYLSFRRCVILNFPFSIFYTIEEDSIIIHAIFNNRQDPNKLP